MRNSPSQQIKTVDLPSFIDENSSLALRLEINKLGNNSHGDEDDGEVYMDPVVYWTSSKDGLGMEELLMSVEDNMFAQEDDDDEFDFLGDETEDNPEYSH